jgi:hypothetical protein
MLGDRSYYFSARGVQVHPAKRLRAMAALRDDGKRTPP